MTKTQATQIKVSALTVEWTDESGDERDAPLEMVIAVPEEYPAEIVDAVVAAQRPATLYDYHTAEPIRPATAEELAASIKQAKRDSGAGVIEVAGRSVYAQ